MRYEKPGLKRSDVRGLMDDCKPSLADAAICVD
jgi:hypothetical protein